MQFLFKIVWVLIHKTHDIKTSSKFAGHVHNFDEQTNVFNVAYPRTCVLNLIDTIVHFIIFREAKRIFESQKMKH